MARSRRPSFKGCCVMCASGKGKARGQGDPERARVTDRRLMGRSRRFGRGEVPTDQLDGVRTRGGRVQPEH